MADELLVTTDEETLIERMGEFSDDSVGWVYYSFPWGQGELVGYDGPDKWQLEVLMALRDGLITLNEAIQIAVGSGHGVGKTAMVAWLILWAMSTKVDTRGVVTANTETQLKTKTWPELQKWHRLFIASHWFNYTATAFYSVAKDHDKTWRVDMVTWSEEKTEAFAGLHNKGNRIILIIDEGSAVPDKIWEVSEGALTDKDTEIIWAVFGNPTRNTGRFYECFHKFKKRWKTFRVDSRDVKITNKEKIAKWIEDYGEDSDFVRVRVKGLHPKASDHQYISSDIIEAARKRTLHPYTYNFAPIIIGIDRAWSGNDTKVWMRQGLFSKRLGTFNKGEDDFLIAGYVARWEDELKADAVFIDFGYGTGVYSAGKQLNRQWKMVEFGGEPMDRQYLNKRMEIWATMRRWLMDGGKINDDEDIAEDLKAPEAFEVQTGKNAGRMKMESKEDMKDRGIDSPDDADALAVTFSYPVKNKRQKMFDTMGNVTNNKYDVFKGNFNNEGNKQFNPLDPVWQIER